MIRISDIGILADDLTGACDVAASFAPFVGPVPVYVSPEAFPGRGRELVVINTQTRLLPAQNARISVCSIGRKLIDKPVIFKKIDSALRGNVGAELEGLIEAVGFRRVIVAPAIPRIDKTTRNGIQYDCGMPIDKTAYAGDPVSPVHSANVKEILGEAGKVKYQVYDAETDDDLRGIVNKARDDSKVVLVGSLGLADAFAEQIERTTPKRKEYIPRARRILLVCGSLYRRVQEQIEKAVARCQLSLIDINPAKTTDIEVQWAPGIRPIVVRFIRPPTKPEVRLSSDALPRFIRAVARLIEKLHPDGLGIIGGETAFHLLRALQTNCLRVHGRISEVLSYGIIGDGTMSGCPFVTKGGSVGADDSVIRMIDYLKNGGRDR